MRDGDAARGLNGGLAMQYHLGSGSETIMTDKSRDTQVREVLIEAVEVQLAALKAAIIFWSDWIDRTSGFVTAATSRLESVRAADENSGQILLEVVDAGRESMRTLSDLPRNAAIQFVRDLEEVAARRKSRGDSAPQAPRATAGRSRSRGGRAPKAAAKRRVRAKP